MEKHSRFPRVSLFNYILDFKRTAISRLKERRRSQRYIVAPGFPLTVTMTLAETDNAGGRRAGAGRVWGGVVTNMSGAGLGLKLPPAAVASRGERSVVVMTFDDYVLSLPCEIAHFRVQSASAHCGIVLHIGESEVAKSYQQLLEAIVLGSSLVSVKPSGVGEHPREFVPEQYKSGRKARLTVWRDYAGQPDSFEFVMGDYCVRGEAPRPFLEIFSRKKKGPKRAWSASNYALSSAAVESDEVRQLFRWVTLNLPVTLPADVRELISFFANIRTNWSAPPLKMRKAGVA